MIRLAYKLVATDKTGIMVSPISYLGLAVRYQIGKWTKPIVGKYLFVYKTIEDAEQVFYTIRKVQRHQFFKRKCEFCDDYEQHLIIVECETKNLRKAVGGGSVPEYRCTKVKPIKVVG